MANRIKLSFWEIIVVKYASWHLLRKIRCYGHCTSTKSSRCERRRAPQKVSLLFSKLTASSALRSGAPTRAPNTRHDALTTCQTKHDLSKNELSKCALWQLSSVSLKMWPLWCLLASLLAVQAQVSPKFQFSSWCNSHYQYCPYLCTGKVNS